MMIDGYKKASGHLIDKMNSSFVGKTRGCVQTNASLPTNGRRGAQSHIKNAFFSIGCLCANVKSKTNVCR